MTWARVGHERAGARLVWAACAAVVSLAGLACAEGYEGVAAIRQNAGVGRFSGGAGLGGRGGAGGMTASGNAGTSGGAAPGTGSGSTGEPCLRNETKTCTCADKGTQGQQICIFDASSPLDGFLSECSRCPDPPPKVEPGDVMSMGGRGGTGGSGGSGGGGSSGSGGRSGSGGGGGTPSTSPPPTGSTRTCSMTCNQPCFPFGILACCNTALGTCGCTWAPGGYCL